MDRRITAQRAALLAGAGLDLAFAIPMLLAPGPASRLLSVELPGDLTWFRLSAVLLLIVAGCYAAAARATEATLREIATVAGIGRLLGCLVLLEAGRQGQGPTVVAVGLVDGLLGSAHLALVASDWIARRRR